MADLPSPVAEVVSAAELAALRRACELAARGAGTTLPNPVVGCVLLAPDGTVVGEGFHERAGGPHAEVVALAAAGERAAGATAVVTLEPCNHTGRTGPCSEALIAAGVARVVVAVRDPWPTAAGGIDRLREAGVDVIDLPAALGDAASREVGRGAAGSGDAVAGDSSSVGPVLGESVFGGPAVGDVTLGDAASGGTVRGVGVAVGDAAGDDGVADDAVRQAVALAEDVNRVWLTATRLGRPFVTLKIAESLDGRVAAPDGSSRWISGPESRADAHRMRAEIDTILVGVGTVLADDPALTARAADGTPGPRQPLRVVLDGRGRTPAGAHVRDDTAPSLIATASDYGADAAGRVDVEALLTDLYRRGRRHLLVEGGPRVAASFLDAGLVDEVLVYLAPLLLGAGRSAVEGGALVTLAGAHRLELVESRRFGGDLVLRYRFLRAASEPADQESALVPGLFGDVTSKATRS